MSADPPPVPRPKPAIPNKLDLTPTKGELLAGILIVFCACLAVAAWTWWKHHQAAAPPPAKSVVILFDPADAGDHRFYLDPSLAAFVAEHGAQLRIEPINVANGAGKQPSYLRPYIAAAKGKHFPFVAVGGGGSVERSLEKPASVEQIVNWLAPPQPGAGAEEHFWDGGHWRKLGGLRPAKPGVKHRWNVEGEMPSEPLIPESDYQALDLGPIAVNDQDGFNSCCPNSGCKVIEQAGRLAGQRPFTLSTANVYSRIDGGSDEGASLEDFQTAAAATGVCTTDFAPQEGFQPPAYKNGYQASQADHRTLCVSLCPDWPSIASAVQRHKPVQFGILAGKGFQPNAAGVIGPKCRKGGGGHAVCAMGMTKVGNDWYIIMQNSWGEGWGGSADGSVRKGCCLLHPSWIEPSFGAYAVAAITCPEADAIGVIRRAVTPVSLPGLYATAP